MVEVSSYILLHLWMLYRQGVILTSSIDLCGIGGSENLNVWPFTSLANLLIFVYPEGGWRGSVATIQALAEGREFSPSCADPMGPNSRSGCLWGGAIVCWEGMTWESRWMTFFCCRTASPWQLRWFRWALLVGISAEVGWLSPTQLIPTSPTWMPCHKSKSRRPSTNSRVIYPLVI